MRHVMAQCVAIARDHPGEKMIIFSEFAQVLRLLQRLLVEVQRVSWNSVLFLGIQTTSEQERRRALDAFEGDPNTRALLMTYKAGGAGMNLQYANHVLEVDQPWTEAVRHQAEGRTWRIGQRRTVHVYRFYSRDTFEEFVMERQADKTRKWNIMQGLIPADDDDEGEDEAGEVEVEVEEEDAAGLAEFLREMLQ